MTLCGFRELEEHPAPFWVLRKWTESVLDSVMTAWPDFLPNQHWAWFHVMEDEVSHRGQIRVIRKAAQQAAQG